MADRGLSAPAIDALLATLERLVTDLRRRTEDAERRAAASEERAALERQAREGESAARHDAELRAAIAEQSANDAMRRVTAAEAAADRRTEELHRELLAATQKALEAAQDAAAAIQTAKLNRQHFAGSEYPHLSTAEQEPSRIPQPAAVSTHSRRPAPHGRGNEEGYAWMEDEPGPPWWRRLFGRRRY
jgi:hypothetical protein